LHGVYVAPLDMMKAAHHSTNEPHPLFMFPGYRGTRNILPRVRRSPHF